MTHPSHDFGSSTGWCLNCGTVHAGQLIASSFPCVPSTDDGADYYPCGMCGSMEVELHQIGGRFVCAKCSREPLPL